jgi:hypothetical protein
MITSYFFYEFNNQTVLKSLPIKITCPMTEKYSFSSILVGSWFFLIYQWWIVSPISFFSHVNIDLIMCQKNYITEILFGSPLKFISLYNYRSIFSILFFPFCILIAYLYIAVTGVLFFVLSFAAIKHNIDEVDRGIEKKNI